MTYIVSSGTLNPTIPYHTESLEALGTHFTVQSRIEAYKNSAKIIPKFTVRPGAVAPSLPPQIRHCLLLPPYLPIAYRITVAY